jgi:membrane protease YdiL (CAAX protease family)
VPWSESVPELSLIAVPLGVLLLMYAVAGGPYLGWWLKRRSVRRRERDRRALVRVYRVTVVVQVLWTAVIVGAVVLSPDLGWSDLGLRLPDASLGTLLPVLAGAVAFAAVLGAFVLFDGGTKRDLAHPDAAPPQYAPGTPAATEAPTATVTATETATVLVPRSRSEYRWALGSRAWAGVAEELLYRGFLVAFGVAAGLPWWLAAAASCLCYALAYVPQGWREAGGPALLGVLYMVLAMGTGSLIPAIVAHVALNVSLQVLQGSGRRRRAR